MFGEICGFMGCLALAVSVATGGTALLVYWAEGGF